MMYCLRLPLSYLVLSFIAFTNLYGQAKETKGTLLRVPFDAQEIDLSDTLGSWFYQSGFEYNSDRTYEDMFNFNSNPYLLVTNFNNQPLWASFRLLLESPALESDIVLAGSAGAIDNIELYLFENYKTQPVETGIWISIAGNRCTFLDNDNNLIKDTLKIEFLHIPGMIDQKYLVVFREPYIDTLYYTLCDLSNSPNVEQIQKINVKREEKEDLYSLLKINQINDSLFFVAYNENEYDWGKIEQKNFFVASLQDTSLIIANNIFEDENLTYWVAFGNRIVGLRDSTLFGQTLNASSLLIENIDTIATNIDQNQYSISSDEKFCAFIKNDSLFVFSLEKETLINSWSLDGIHRRNSPLIDSPYVYIQQITTVVGVEDADELPKKFTLSQNYPNPFNPTTTIKFTIPNVGTSRDLSLQTNLIVYDVLGREVKTLLNKPMQPGEYKVEFDGTNLTSGVYFYVLEIAGIRLGKKMVLIK